MVVSVVGRSPVELWHVLVPKTELPRWRRHHSENLWLQLVPSSASRDAPNQFWGVKKNSSAKGTKDWDLTLRRGANAGTHALSSTLRGSGEYQMHVLRDHARA